MKRKEIVASAIILAISIIAMGMALRSGIVAFKNMDKHVTVKGLAEREVKADKVT